MGHIATGSIVRPSVRLSAYALDLN